MSRDNSSTTNEKIKTADQPFAIVYIMPSDFYVIASRIISLAQD